MQLSKHFKLQELIHPVIHRKIGDRAADWLNPNLIITLEALREMSGRPIKVNDWHVGGNYKDSGLRCGTAPLNGKVTLSSHYAGCAADLKFSGIEPDKIYFHILNNQDKYPFISRMENIEHTPTWAHIEVSTSKRTGEIYIFNP